MGCLELISVACVRNDKAVFQSIPTLAEKLAPEEGTLLIVSPKISGAERARIAIQQGQAVEGSPTKTFGVVGTETRSEKAKSTHCREEKKFHCNLVSSRQARLKLGDCALDWLWPFLGLQLETLGRFGPTHPPPAKKLHLSLDHFDL